jgi:hypothetical protein
MTPEADPINVDGIVVVPTPMLVDRGISEVAEAELVEETLHGCGSQGIADGMTRQSAIAVGAALVVEISGGAGLQLGQREFLSGLQARGLRKQRIGLAEAVGIDAKSAGDIVQGGFPEPYGSGGAVREQGGRVANRVQAVHAADGHHGLSSSA